MRRIFYFILGVLILLIAFSYIYFVQELGGVDKLVDQIDTGINENSTHQEGNFSSIEFSKKEKIIYFSLIGLGFILTIIYILFTHFY